MYLMMSSSLKRYSNLLNLHKKEFLVGNSKNNILKLDNKSHYVQLILRVNFNFIDKCRYLWQISNCRKINNKIKMWLIYMLQWFLSWSYVTNYWIENFVPKLSRWDVIIFLRQNYHINRDNFFETKFSLKICDKVCDKIVHYSW